MRVLVWPVRVQGETSAAEVAAAIDGFNALAAGGVAPRPDVLIVARGGGSLEDLWGFNEEIVVRAAARSAIPLIAAVGHETDWTLIDHVADLRAPTPTAAAEFATPVRAELIASVADLDARRRGAMRRLQERRRADLRAIVRALPSGETFVGSARQRLDRAGEALAARCRAAVDSRALRLAGLARGLARHSPRAHLAGLGERVRGLSGRLERIGPLLIERPRRETDTLARGLARGGSLIARRRMEMAEGLMRLVVRLDRAHRDGVKARRDRLTGLWQLAAAVSYRGVLARGFALVHDETGRALRRASEAREGERLTIEFADGIIPAIAGRGPASEPTTLAAPMPQPRPKRPRDDRNAGGQGSLF